MPATEFILFMSKCHKAIADMRRHGMNDTIISCVLYEVRAAAIAEESFRLKRLVESNPPPFGHPNDILDEINNYYKPESHR